ncbi:phosphoketolase family protein [Streptomyces californicus]
MPEAEARLGSTPYANGGRLLRDLPLPDLANHAVPVDRPGTALHEPTKVLGGLLESVMAATAGRRDFRVVGPDETASNRLDALYHATGKAWQAGTLPTDEHLAHDGRVMEVLSEHLCQGWLEGYLLTGRHGLFSSYEAFAHIVDSMVNQHIKWLRTSRRLPWRRPIASLNYLLTSHVWRQDHNGFSHQDPGFVDHILNKSPEVVRVYLPPDANTLLSAADHALRSRDYVNVIVAGKQPTFDWLTLDEARAHCARVLGLARGPAPRTAPWNRTWSSPAPGTSPTQENLLRPICSAVTCRSSPSEW